MVEKITILNKANNQSITIDKDGDGRIILDDEAIDWGEVKVNFGTYKAQKQVGYSVSSQDIDGRNVIIVGWLYGDESTISKMQLLLARIINPTEEVRITIGDWYIDGFPQSQISFGATIETNNEVMCKFTAQLYCPNPLFFGVTKQETSYYEESKAFSFPFSFKGAGAKVVFGIRTVPTLKSITNNGVSELGAVITIQCLSESCENVKLFKLYDQSQFIIVNKALTYGEKVTIDTRIGEQSIIGEKDGVEEDYFRYWNYDNEWLKFPVGETYLAVSSDTSNAVIDVNVSIENTSYVIGGM